MYDMQWRGKDAQGNDQPVDVGQARAGGKTLCQDGETAYATVGKDSDGIAKRMCIAPAFNGNHH